MLFSFTNIAGYQQKLRSGEFTCKQATEHYINQAKANARLNAFVAIFESEALRRAEDLDNLTRSGKSAGSLHGVVVAIKDVLNFKGHAVTAASRVLQGYEAIYNATAVQKLLNEGAIILGIANCDEFAMGSTNENSLHGPVLNAIDESRVPGGSSGGSAVAVQAGLCMVSLGSDTGGSVRQPADFCGIFGMKPTYGRISRYGLIAYASSFDQIGVFANSVEDVALVYESIAGKDVLDGTSSNRPVDAWQPREAKNYRFAYLAPTMELPGLDEEIKGAIGDLFDRLRQEGNTVEAVPFGLLDYIVPAYYVLTTAEASSNLSRFDGVRYGHHADIENFDLTEYYKQNRSRGFGAEVKRRIMLGSFVLSAGYYDAYFDKAQQVRRLIFNQTTDIFEDFDAIIMPVSPTTAFKLGEKIDDPVAMYLADIYTVFANLAGIPGMSVPLFKHSNGMPFGIQVLANRWDELSLHQISQYLASFSLKENTVG
jgi:aspartyl-tRNA(Asn)/glutamyl-tRNA(Gln) amidotransferase subunit A